MAEFTVEFLSQTFTLPDEIIEYIVYCEQFQPIKNELADVMLKSLELPLVDDEFRFLGFLERDLPDAMRTSGKKVVDMLAKNSVFNITLKELVDQNVGFIHLQTIHQKIVQRISSNMREHLIALQSGQANISRNAYSQVTGSGVTLYSNSIAQHLAFSAFETSTLHKQYSKAEREYKSAMMDFVNRTHSVLDQKNAAVVDENLPEIVDSIEDFLSELMEKYFSGLQNAGIFNYANIKLFSIEHSGEILKNLEIVDDKMSVLRSAFQACPYNLEIYMALLEYGIEDMSAFQTAKVLGLEKMLAEKISEFCRTKKSAGGLPKFTIAVLALLTSKSLTDTLREILEDEIAVFVNEYQTAKQAVSDNKKLDVWIRKYIAPETEKLIQCDDAGIKKHIAKTVKQIGAGIQYKTLICNKLLPSELMFWYGKQIASFEEFEAVLTELLYLRVAEYIKEARRRKAIYEKADKEKMEAISKCYLRIEKLRADLKAVGIFAFSKRSEIKSMIDDELDKKNTLEDDTQYVDELYRAFKEMYR